MTTSIHVRDLSGGTGLELRPGRVVIAGFTGRDHAAVEAHIDELRELGVPVPERTPTFYEVDPSLLTTADRIEVSGSFTSGEVEPVLIVHNGARYLTVGSDHTDRDVERSSIEASKRACPKAIGREVLPLASLATWDDLELSSWAGGAPGRYQEGRLAQLLPLESIVASLGEAVAGRPATAWSALLRARAIENQAFVIGCNAAGVNHGVELGGHSAIIDPWGEAVAEAGAEPTRLDAVIDPSAAADARADFPALRDRVWASPPSSIKVTEGAP